MRKALFRRWAACFALAALALPASAAERLPDFAALEAQGAIIGRVDVRSENVFDTSNPAENNALFRAANHIHVPTKPETMLRALLFRRGEAVSARRIEETERILRAHRYIYDVTIKPLAVNNGVVDIEVTVRDTWTLEPSIKASRSGGSNTTGIGVREDNLLGTGVSVNLSHKRDVDRSSKLVEAAYDHAFDGWTQLRYGYADNSDGHRQSASVIRPFHALDARWAAGVSALGDDRIEAIYRGGKIASEYRHEKEKAELFGGWSAGWVDGWTKRTTVGLLFEEDHYAFEPGRVAPPRLPVDETVAAVYARLDLIEDDFVKETNRNQVHRPEYFARGLNASVMLGRSMESLGASDDRWIYGLSVSRGFTPVADHDLQLAATMNGHYRDGSVLRQARGVQARYYWPLSDHWLLYGSLALDALTRPSSADLLTLGGDNGLRGYPLRFQTGERRAQLTVEARAYTDLYLFSLFRVGWAAFYDVGSAWGGLDASQPHAEWMQDVGVGLRVFSVRSAQGTVLHADVATPVNRPPGVKGVQFLLKTKSSF